MQNAAASNTSADNLAILIDMGFSEQQAREALHRVENVEDAVVYLLNGQIQPSPPSSPGVSQADTSDDEASYAANPRCMQFIINTGHPHLSFSACLLNIAQASFDLYDQIMEHRSQLLSFKTWHNHGELKQLFECNTGNQLRELNQQFEIALEDNQICTALINDSKYHEPVCLAVFGIASYLEQYTSQLKHLRLCPSKFFINDTNDDDENTINDDEKNSETTRKQ
ncbi:unnamed protein product [Adineta steineri]|uniref:peptidyl-tRNA hydrolase n=1 Tax=Adineta steineri TaxID=433720 RepID=A0A819XCL1_9BILA|nr:unnamed protein product [Adineta steineri]CAF1403501.1 unnamed protein product [Adineta steineri]CAF3735085.1 unnamed protein product [Adineta steineri]CAF4138795.1 unnamed protein product [Adineta steineri]